MLVTAHGGWTPVPGQPDNQHVYNAARNVEIAVWLLSSWRNAAAGQLLLLADTGLSAT
jgi:hypothetical protein